MSSVIQSRSGAMNALGLLMLGGLLIAPTAAFPPAATVGFLVMAVGYFLLSRTLTPGSQEQLFARIAAGLECAAIVIGVTEAVSSYSMGANEPLEFSYGPKIALGVHVLALASYLRVHAILLPELKYVASNRAGAMNMLAVVAAILGLVVMGIMNPLGALIGLGVHLFVPVLVMVLWVEIWKLPADEASRGNVLIWGIIKLVGGLAVAGPSIGCMVVMFDQWWPNQNGEAMFMIGLLAAPASLGAWWLVGGTLNVFGKRLAWWQGIGVGILIAAAVTGGSFLFAYQRLVQWEDAYWQLAEQEPQKGLSTYYSKAPEGFWRPEAVEQFWSAGEQNNEEGENWRNRRRSILRTLDEHFADDSRFAELRKKLRSSEESNEQDAKGDRAPGSTDGIDEDADRFQ